MWSIEKILTRVYACKSRVLPLVTHTEVVGNNLRDVWDFLSTQFFQNIVPIPRSVLYFIKA